MATIRLKQLTTGNYTFESLYYDDDGAHHNVKAPLTLTIKDGGGTTIYTGTPTLHSGHADSTIPLATLPKLDSYTFNYTATTDPGNVAVAWTDTIEIVGGYIFEISELRAQDRAFLDANKYPTETLKAVRTAVENVIEGARAAQVAFVPRGRRVKLDGNAPDFRQGWQPLMYGNDYRTLLAPDYEIRKIHSVKIDGTALTQAEIDEIGISDNQLWRSNGVQWPAWPFGHRNIELHYEHGLDQPTGAIRRAALILAREYLIKSDLPGRATATSIGDQIFRLTIAGRDGLTGIPDVDAAIKNDGRAGYGLG